MFIWHDRILPPLRRSWERNHSMLVCVYCYVNIVCEIVNYLFILDHHLWLTGIGNPEYSVTFSSQVVCNFYPFRQYTKIMSITDFFVALIWMQIVVFLCTPNLLVVEAVYLTMVSVLLTLFIAQGKEFRKRNNLGVRN